MPSMTDILATLRTEIAVLRAAAGPRDDPMVDFPWICADVANDLALLHDSLEADHKRHVDALVAEAQDHLQCSSACVDRKRQVDALVAEDRLEEIRADALANGTFYNQDEDDSWETGL